MYYFDEYVDYFGYHFISVWDYEGPITYYQWAQEEEHYAWLNGACNNL